jgi:hypothetical protein
MSSPRLLFVLSNDYGELSSALYFLEGTDLSATLLMPERLFRANAEGPLVPTECYRSSAEILAAVDRERPAIVFLFSAYLYAINGLLDLKGVGALIRGLKERNLGVVTSDPFLGVMTHPDESLFAADHPLRSVLAGHFAQLSPLVRGLAHLYFMPTEGIAVADRVWFANPGAIRADRAGDEGPSWLFIVSAEDYAHQAASLGRDAFERLLLEHLGNATRQGRRPVLIGPMACIESMRSAGKAIPEAVLMPFCRHDVFRDQLLGAEHVFYWNVFSNSILARVMNRRPVFFFARGHMAHAIPRLYDAGLRHYYPDCELPWLDPRAVPTAESLARLAERQRSGFASALRCVEQAPSPAQVVAKLVEGRSS